MRLMLATALVSSLLLLACGQTNPPPAPAAVTQAAPAIATAPAPSSAPAAVSAAAAVTGPEPATAAGSTAAPAAATGDEAAEEAGPEQAGDVVLAQGDVTDTATDGSKRVLKDGDDVFPGDSLVLGADSYLDIDFSDGGRILLRPNTSFQIQEYHFDPDAHPNADVNAGQDLLPPTSAPKPESAFFRLVKGGLRAVDGLIGQTHHENYGIETPVATIGVRGTAFDVRYCGDDCQDEADATGAPADGLYTAVSEGTIAAKNDAGEAVIPAGESSFVKTRHTKGEVSKKQHRALRHMQLPEKYQARDEAGRVKMKARRHERRKAQLERRRQRAAHLKQLKQQQAAKPATSGRAERPAKPGTRAGKLEQRREDRREQRREAKGNPGTAQGQAAAGPMKQPNDRQKRAAQRLQDQGAAQPKPEAGARKKARGWKAEPVEAKPKPGRTAKQDKSAKQPPAKADKPKKTDDSCKDKKNKKQGKDKDKGKDDC